MPIFSSAAGFCGGLGWGLEEPSARRPGFPSWSWTGWVGPVKWIFSEADWKAQSCDPDVGFSVELHDGRRLQWHEFQESYEELNRFPYPTHYIRMSAWTTPLRIPLTHRFGQHSQVGAIAYFEDESYVSWYFSLTTSEPLTDELHVGILLGSVPDRKETPSDDRLIVPIIVGTVGDITEHVGFGVLDLSVCNCYGPDGVLQNRGYVPRAGLLKSRREIRLG